MANFAMVASMANFGQLPSFAHNARPGVAAADMPKPGVPVADKAAEYAELWRMMAEHQQGQQQQLQQMIMRLP